MGWVDWTVAAAVETGDFYGQVTGWIPEPFDMGGYNDFVMKTPDGAAVAGVCHARGGNKDLPPHWLVYLTVEHLNQSTERCYTAGLTVVPCPRHYAGAGLL